MKKSILLVATLFISILVYAQKSTDNFAGKWKTEEGEVIEISKAGNIFKGKAVDKNKVVMKDVKFIDGKWKGMMVKPKDGTEVNCELVLEGNKLKIIAKKGMMSKTIIWSK